MSSSQQFPEAEAKANLGDNLNTASTEQHRNQNLGKKSRKPSSLKSEQLCRHFSLAEILLATNNFDDTLVIGQGGFGKVYKGVVDNGAVTVAIKRLSPMSKQGAPQFWTEVKLLSRFRHSHLVSLIGYCNNRNEMILVYEYMARGALADHLYKARPNDNNNTSTLSWVQRLKICKGAAQGLDYLHTGTGIHDRVIHPDLKSSNILLDDSWAAKVSDFGLSKIGPVNQNSTHVSTNVKGTFGYLDPEYLVSRRLTRKSDVYSFGVVLLEVLSGRRAVDSNLCMEQRDLVGWAIECIEKEELDQIIDPYLKWEILQNSLKAFVQIAEKCLHYRSKKRPTMAEVVASLECALSLQERRDSSMFDEDFLNLGWTLDNQENPDDSTGQPEVNNEGEVIDHIASSRALSSLPSRVRPPRILRLKRMARLFLFGKSHLDSAINETSNLEYLQYDFGNIRAATHNFNPINKLGQGRSGVVYKGIHLQGRLQDGRYIAVKKLSSDFLRAESEFRNEMLLGAKLQHWNLVRLLGFCLKGTERLLVYEFVPNYSLDYYLYDPVMRTCLDWRQRHKIIRGVAQGLLYLHKDSPVRIIHRDLKPQHILLDAEMSPKISDFGSAISLKGEESEVNVSNVVGTSGYIAPECLSTLHVSVKSDVFSFGIVILEILSGRRAFPRVPEEIFEPLRIYALRNWREGMCSNVIDPQLSGSQISVHEEEIKRCIQIGLLCVQEYEADRPTMSSVVLMLNNSSLALPEPSERHFSLALPEPSEPPSFMHETSNFESLQYDFGTIRAATDNFSPINKLGQGRSGVVYKGRLQDGRYIAVKKLSSDFLRAESEFRNGMLLGAKLQHRNLVRLLGFCLKETERLLVYEFVPNYSLDYYLYDPVKHACLDWGQRHKIIRGVARGLLYLHEDSLVRIIHRDLKPQHILLDSEMSPKISDFGPAILLEGEESEVTVSTVVGTLGYIAPECLSTLRVSVKSDVFNFGIVILEILSGRRAFSCIPEEISEPLRIYALRNWREGTCSNLIDPQLSGSQISVHEEEIKRCIQIGLLCAQEYEAERPTISSVVLMLNNSSLALPEPSEPPSFGHDIDMPLQNLVNSYVHDIFFQNSVYEGSTSPLSPR